MLRLCVVAAVALLVGGRAAALDKPNPKALKELEGMYAVVAASAGGTELQADARKAAHARITGDEIVITVRDKAHPAKVTRLDPAAHPAAVDLAPSDGPEKGKTFPGIYTYKDGELTLAIAEKGDRPKGFTPAPGVLLLKLRKAPSGKE